MVTKGLRCGAERYGSGLGDKRRCGLVRLSLMMPPDSTSKSGLGKLIFTLGDKWECVLVPRMVVLEFLVDEAIMLQRLTTCFCATIYSMYLRAISSFPFCFLT